MPVSQEIKGAIYAARTNLVLLNKKDEFVGRLHLSDGDAATAKKALRMFEDLYKGVFTGINFGAAKECLKAKYELSGEMATEVIRQGKLYRDSIVTHMGEALEGALIEGKKEGEVWNGFKGSSCSAPKRCAGRSALITKRFLEEYHIGSKKSAIIECFAERGLPLELTEQDVIRRFITERRLSEVYKVGIENAGSSCYLGAALQVVAAIPQLKSIFDPGSTVIADDDKKAKVQRDVYRVLEYISSEENVGDAYEGSKINKLRDELHGAGVLYDPRGQMDAGETIEASYLYMTGKSLDESMKRVSFFEDINVDESVVVAVRDDYSTVEELRSEKVERTPLNLSVPTAPATYASMHDFHGKANERVVSFDAVVGSLDVAEEVEVFFNTLEEGSVVSRKTKGIKRTRLSADHVWPEVLPVRIFFLGSCSFMMCCTIEAVASSLPPSTTMISSTY
jgi:hypothetical protein